MAKQTKEKFDFIGPFKDIPKALKGFPKNIIHIWKDPVKNSAEVAERKKEIFPLLYLFACICIVFVVLGAFVVDIFTMLAMIPAIGVAICGFLLTVLKKAAQKFADLECDNCKKLIAYDDNVQIRIVNKTFDIKKEDRTIEKNNVPVESTIEVKGTELVTVEITCKCQECGTEKKFMHTFTTMRCNKGAVKIPYVQSGARLIQYESDVREAYENGLCEVHEIHPVKAEVSVGGKTASSVTTSNGVNITYKRPIESLVKGYFGNELN